MIKSTHTNAPKKKKKRVLTYPLLAQHLNDFIVLFTHPKTGTVVDAGKGYWPLGRFRTDWGFGGNAFLQEEWRVLEKGEKVTLQVK